MNYVYMLRCKDDSLYTGWTTNLDRRIKKHNAGKGAKYTRGRGPVELVYYEKYETKKEATKREYEIKRLHKKYKEKLVEEFKK